MAAQLPPAASLIPAPVLRQVPGCEDGRPPSAVLALPGGGGRNRVLRVDTARGRFVWRSRLVPEDRPGSVAVVELRAHAAAAAAGLAPAVVAADPRGHWLLMEFIDAPVWTDARLSTPEGSRLLAAQLGRLHALPVPSGLAPLDASAIARGYVAQLQHTGGATAAEVHRLLGRAEALSSELARQPAALALVHGDLVATNLLGDGPCLLDWEYAQVADPGWDLACLLAYHPALRPAAGDLARHMGMLEVDMGRLARLQELFAALSGLWALIHEPGVRQAAGDDYPGAG